MYKNQGIIAGKENARVPESKGESPAPRIMDGINEHLHNRTSVQNLDVQIQGRQNATW